MVSLEISKKDLLKLIGKKLSNEQLEEVLFLIKVEVEFSDDKLDCELDPDRPDMFSVEGIARSVKGFLGIETGLPNYRVKKSKVSLKAEKVESRPFIVCAIIENVKLSDELVKSLMQVQEKLHMTTGRNRKKVAIGVHDLDKVKPPFLYKEVLPEEIRFIPLDMSEKMNLKEILRKHPKGKDYAFCLENYKKYPVILDKEDEVLSFPPIINGELTKVTEKTKNLFIEITGTDEKAVNQALNILVCNIVERTGKIKSVKIGKKEYPNLDPVQKRLETGEVNKLLGLGLKKNQIIRILERMRYSVIKFKKGLINVLIPAYRTDILHTVDLIEDVAIGYGYNNIVPELPKIATIGGLTKIEKDSSKIRELLIGLGLQEVMTFVLTNKKNQFKKMNLGKEEIVEIDNPVSSEFDVCRKWLLPNLLKVLAANKHRDYPQKIFEIGDCVVIGNSDTNTKTIRKLAGVVCYDFANLTEMKSVVEAVLKNLGLNYSIKPFKHSSFTETRCGEILSGKKSLGFFGEVHPQVLENWKLEKPVIGFEMILEY